MKLKDKPTADALVVWYAAAVEHRSLVFGLDAEATRIAAQAVDTAAHDLAAIAVTDSTGPLAAWLAAYQAYDMVHIELAVRLGCANSTLLEACTQGVTCAAQGQDGG
jgi:hypothetical protein